MTRRWMMGLLLGADAVDDGACDVVATFDFAAAGHTVEAYGAPRVVDTGVGWLVVYERAEVNELWASAVSYAGQIVTAPTSLGAGHAPQLAIHDGGGLLGFTDDAGTWLQRLTVTGGTVGSPVAVAEIPDGGTIAGIVAGPGATLRVIWHQVIPEVFPERPSRSNVGVLHVDGDGAVLASTPSVVIGATGLSAVLGRADGSIAAGTSARYAVAGCFACFSAGTAELSAGDVVTDHGMAPPDPDRGSAIRSIAQLGATTFVDRQALSPIGSPAGVATLARFPYDPVATIAASDSVIVGLAPTAGAIATVEPDGSWLRSFTEAGALGPRCRLEVAPRRLARRDATTVLVLGDRSARVVAVAP